jgi:EamA-like transporter family
MKLLDNWIFLSVFAAIIFALGDFVVVGANGYMDIKILYVAFIICTGLVSLIYILMHHKDLFGKLRSEMSYKHWALMLGFCFIYFFGYLSHLQAIQIAPNPGYSNALVMLHIAILTVLSYMYLGKPVNSKAIYGIGIMFIGAYTLIMNSDQKILHSNV